MQGRAAELAWRLSSRISFLRSFLAQGREKRLDEDILGLGQIRTHRLEPGPLIERKLENQFISVANRFAKADLQLLEAGGVLLGIHTSGGERLDGALHLVAIAFEISEGLFVLVRLQIGVGLLDFEVAQFSEYFGLGHGIVFELILRFVLLARLLSGRGDAQAGAQGHAAHKENTGDKSGSTVWIPSHFRRGKAAFWRRE